MVIVRGIPELVLMLLIYYGGTVLLMPKFDAAGWLAFAQAERVTHTMLVPVQYRRLMARPDFDAHDLGSFRMKFSTSAPFDAALKADVLARWPGGLVEFYGMTEGGGTCILEAHAHPDKLHTVGRPAEGHDIRLIDEQGREVPRGDVRMLLRPWSRLVRFARVILVGTPIWYAGGVLFVFAVGLLTVVRFLLTGQ